MLNVLLTFWVTKIYHMCNFLGTIQLTVSPITSETYLI